MLLKSKVTQNLPLQSLDPRQVYEELLKKIQPDNPEDTTEGRPFSEEKILSSATQHEDPSTDRKKNSEVT